MKRASLEENSEQMATETLMRKKAQDKSHCQEVNKRMRKSKK